MGYLFDRTLDQYLAPGATPVTGVPFSMGLWFNTRQDTNNATIMSITDTDANNYFALWMGLDNTVGANTRAAAGGNETADSTTLYTIDTWNHALAVFPATNLRTVYLNGGGKGTDVVDVTPVSIDDVYIGRLRLAGFSFDGILAEVGIWNIGLSDADARTLGRGVRPPFVRPGNLVAYWPLVYPTIAEWWTGTGRYNLTAYQGPVRANHPPNVNFDGLAGPNLLLRAPTPKQFWIIPFLPGLVVGTTCWGHVTGVLETNIRTFDNNWSGTGEVQNVGGGDTERVALEAGENMISEVVDTDTNTVELLQNEYAVGDDVDLDYRHGATEAACLAAAWNNYVAPFVSLGYVQVRLTSTL